MDELVTVALTVLLAGGLVLSWRLVDWRTGFSSAGRLNGELLLLAAVTLAWVWFGATAGLSVFAFSTVVMVVGVMPTPSMLRRANLLRSTEAREAVANSRTLWESYRYRPQRSTR